MSRSTNLPASAAFSPLWSGESAAGAAWRALLLFVLLFALPRLLVDKGVVWIETPGLLVTYALLTLAIFRFLQQRSASDEGVPDDATLLADDAAHPALTDTVLDLDARVPEPEKPRKWSLELLHALEWKRMSELCLAFYAGRGLRGEVAATGVDGSVDARLYQADASEPFALLHCKARGSRSVDVDAVQVLLVKMQAAGVGKAFFMGAWEFTPAARELARAHQVQLVDDKMFLAMLARLKPEESKPLLALAVAGDYRTPSCPACGLKMIARASEQGRYWGCRAYPRCKASLGMAAEPAHG